MDFKGGDIIVHRKLGRGEITKVFECPLNKRKTITFIDVIFDNDKYDVRRFSAEAVSEFIIKHIPASNEQ